MQQSPSLASILGVTPTDLLPLPTQARTITIGDELRAYQVSKRLYDALEAESHKRMVPTGRLFRELRDEINTARDAAHEN